MALNNMAPCRLSQNYYPFVCPHKPIMQHFLVLAEWDFSSCLSFLLLLSWHLPVFALWRKTGVFSSGEGGGYFGAGPWRVDGGGIIFGST